MTRFMRRYFFMGKKKGAHDYNSLFIKTMRYSLRRALFLDSVDGYTHNPTIIAKRQVGGSKSYIVHDIAASVDSAAPSFHNPHLSSKR